MARNSEKAMSTLSRWRQAQTKDDQKRPHLAHLCGDLKEAEKWRRQIIREFSDLVLLIQNAGLGEFKIRDMNDQINKLLREKRHWERRIIELGGHNHMRRFESDDGTTIGTRNYKYFGAAKDLPGVRELFAKPEKEVQKINLRLAKINCDYFGYRDEDDGQLLPLEEKAEQLARNSQLAGQSI